ncbi:DciA family protein [Nocardia thailandica]|uniref:DciA family protein n=1 Tax=Nocardia thailandica TaxID=257275 RepID=UPI0012F9FAD8|nr:DciA family protein [Nocardia thailandica]
MSKRSKEQRRRDRAAKRTRRTGHSAPEAERIEGSASVGADQPARGSVQRKPEVSAWPGARLVIAKWYDIVGKAIGDVAVPVSCTDGVLTVRATSPVLVEQLRALGPEILTNIESYCGEGIVSELEVVTTAPGGAGQRRSASGWEPQLGATRLAARMAAALDLPVAPEDIWELSHLGCLEEIGTYLDRPMYRISDADLLCVEQSELVAEVVATRLDWIDSSYSEVEARRILALWPDEFDRLTAEYGIAAGRLERYNAEEIEGLAADSEFRERAIKERLVGPDQASELLGIRRTDFDHCVDAGWITPAEYVSKTIRRGREVRVALYRWGDVKGLLGISEVDWDAVRATPSGSASLLLRFAKPSIDRAAAIRNFVGDASRRFGVRIGAKYYWRLDQWVIRWEPDHTGSPTYDAVETQLSADPDTSAFLGSIVLETGVVDERWRPVELSNQHERTESVHEHADRWTNLRAKLLERLDHRGRAPGITCRDAEVLATKLRSCGVVSVRLGDEQAWLSDVSLRMFDLDPSDEIALLTGKLEDSGEYRFAPNLTKRQARSLLEFIAATERTCASACDVGSAAVDVDSVAPSPANA